MVLASSTRSAMVSMPTPARGVDQRAHLGLQQRVIRQALHQGAVDLDEIQRQCVEHAQRIDAGAEVLQRKAHARSLECRGRVAVSPRDDAWRLPR